ncbi:hypothetical protein M422DRAFT_275881, partial [Sphaerobolus stellatus SS14]
SKDDLDSSPISSKRRKLSVQEDGNTVIGPSQPLPSSGDLSEDCQTPIPPAREVLTDSEIVHDNEPMTDEPSTFWFTDAGSFGYWVAKGREALAQLGIKENPDVVPDPENE